MGSGFDHLAIQVDTLTTTLEMLTDADLEPEPVQYPSRPARAENIVAHRPRRLPDRVGAVATRNPDGITEADFS